MAKVLNRTAQRKGKSTILIALLVVGILACHPADSQEDPAKWDVAALWQALLQRRPYAYTIPLHTKPSKLDGIYTKKALKTAPHIPCRRCPDWAPEAGIWRLQLKNGVYHVIHLTTGWKSIGTFFVTDDRLLLANDPVCIDGIGLYKWSKKNGQLVFAVIDDPCHIQLRAKNLTETPWQSCQPPHGDAATTTHWPTPEGCR